MLIRPIYNQADLDAAEEVFGNATAYQRIGGGSQGRLLFTGDGAYTAEGACTLSDVSSVDAIWSAAASDLATKTTQLAKPHTIGGFRAESFFGTAGTATMHPTVFGILFRVSNITGTKRVCGNRPGAGGSGWSFTLTSGAPSFLVTNSGGSNVSRTGSTLSGSSTIHGGIATYDDTTLSYSQDKGSYSSTTPGTGGYTAPSGVFGVGGTPSGGTLATNVDVLGIVLRLSGSALSSTDKNTWFDDCKSAGKVVEPPGGADHLWNVRGMMLDSLPLALWNADTGSTALIARGTGSVGQHRCTITRIDSPTWGW